MSESPKQYPLRMAPEFYERLSARAAANSRSMNAEILAILENALDGGGSSEFKAIFEEFERLNRLHHHVEAIGSELDQRRLAIMHQMRAIAASDTADSLPNPLKERAMNVVSKINDIFSKHGRE